MKRIQVMSDLRKLGFLCLALIFITSLVSCNGGSSSTSGNATISGVVADGYVKNAQVFVYSDAGMTNQIGSGTTDDSGNFSITLSVSAVPDTVYIKSVGGTIIDTGMPAPTMTFIGSNTLSAFNVTPLTDSLYKYTTSKRSMNSAADYMKNKLGLSDTSLIWGDPVANSDLQDELYKVLSSGTQGGTLPDGQYKVTYLRFGEDDINNATFTGIDNIISQRKEQFYVTISNGEVSGTTNDGKSVVGRVQGSALLMNFQGTNSVTRICGNIGLLSSVSGVYTRYSTGSTEPVKGVFVATFIPSTGLDSQEMANVITQLYTGARHTLFRDIFGSDHDIGWGDVNITSVDPDTNTVRAASPFSVMVSSNTNVDPTSTTLNFQSGKLVAETDGTPNNIIILSFTETSGTDYFIQPVGSRKGIYICTDTTGTVTGIGDSYMSKTESLAPSFDAGTQYNVSLAVVPVMFLGQSRANNLDLMHFSNSFSTPSDITTTPYVRDSQQEMVIVFNGSMLAFKQDADGDFADPPSPGQPADYIRFLELYETGAMQGEEINGGSLDFNQDGQLDSLCKFPVTFVGYIKKQGESAPSFTGILNSLFRVLYALDYSEYANAYYTGILSIQGRGANTVTLNWRDASGNNTGTATLSCENLDGLLHIYGADDPNDDQSYIDLYWPIGGQKAVYVHSDSSDGQGTIDELGEAYLTY
ncbi:MAG: hypothetical protein LWW94_05925 [Candidatus Desulfofervidaceae bacterium]|nr:hypothetical protein [Candidatus Desulfofervidaceae bacterium]